MEQTIKAPSFSIDEERTLQEVKKLSDYLDTRFQLPFGWRIGWDGILGFIPGVGDLTTNLLSLYIVYKSAVLGCPLSVVIRMGLNILIDNVIDTIPLVGNFLDFAWKANSKNLDLLNEFLQNPHQAASSSRWVVFGALVVMTLLVAGLVVLTYLLSVWIWGLFRAAW